MRIIGGEVMRGVMNTRKLRSELDGIALELDKVPDQPGPEDWQEPELSQEVKEHLKQCDQLRQELRSLKRQRR